VNLKQKQFKEIDDYIFVETDGKIISKSLCKDICYIEGLKNYVAIHLNDKITNNTKEY
jgi:hypothetical protein